MNVATKILLSLSIFSILVSCQENSENSEIKPLDYSNTYVLDSLMNSTEKSLDTMFLGITMGMTEKEYVSHMKKLLEDGKLITFSKSNKFNTAVGTMDLGEGYSFSTGITTSNNQGNKVKGKGDYFFETKYNEDGKLKRLAIVSVEAWDDYESGLEGWLEANIKQNSSNLDIDLRKALVDNEIVPSKLFLMRQKNNLVIYENYMAIVYIDRRTLLGDMLSNELEKNKIEEENEEITF